MAKRRRKSYSERIRNPRFLFSLVMATVFVVIFVIGLVATPSTNTNTGGDIDDSAVLNPTQPPQRITVPTPNPNGPQLTMGQPTIQTNGLFQVTTPTDYFSDTNTYEFNTSRARITFRNPTRLSILDIMLQFGVNYPSLQALSDDLLNEAFFQDAWRVYDGFSETRRTIDDTVTVDFNLIADEIDFLGRQIAWLDGDRLQMVRIIVPSNNPPLLEELSQSIPSTFIDYKDQDSAHPSYNAYNDPQQGFLVRHPGWQQVSGNPGGAAVFEDLTGTSRLTVRAVDDTPLTSLEAAQDYVTQELQPTAEVLSAQQTTRSFGDGYYISYADTDTEGNPFSGLTVLLNDSEDRLHIADIELNEADVDLLSLDEDAVPTAQQIRDIADSFMPLPPQGYTDPPAG